MMHDDNGLDNPRFGNLPGQSVEMIMVDRCSVFGSEELTIGQMGPGRIRHCHRGPCRGRLGVAHPRKIGPERAAQKAGGGEGRARFWTKFTPTASVIRPSPFRRARRHNRRDCRGMIQIRAGTTRCASRVNVGGKFRCGLSARPPATISASRSRSTGTIAANGSRSARAQRSRRRSAVMRRFMDRAPQWQDSGSRPHGQPRWRPEHRSLPRDGSRTDRRRYQERGAARADSGG